MSYVDLGHELTRLVSRAHHTRSCTTHHYVGARLRIIMAAAEGASSDSESLLVLLFLFAGRPVAFEYSWRFRKDEGSTSSTIAAQ